MKSKNARLLRTAGGLRRDCEIISALAVPFFSVEMGKLLFPLGFCLYRLRTFIAQFTKTLQFSSLTVPSVDSL